MQGLAKKRRSARVILLDETRCVLLIRFVIMRSGCEVAFWATPGGTVEKGETDLEAARREIAEELNLDVPLAGPVHEETECFEHAGSFVENTDVFFVGRCHRDVPELTGVTESEVAAMREFRWWRSIDFAGSSEAIFPTRLASIVGAL